MLLTGLIILQHFLLGGFFNMSYSQCDRAGGLAQTSDCNFKMVKRALPSPLATSLRKTLASPAIFRLRNLSPLSIIAFKSSSASGLRTNTRHRDRSGEITSKEGFSVVAPIKMTVPCSTCGRSASCWALLNR